MLVHVFKETCLTWAQICQPRLCQPRLLSPDGAVGNFARGVFELFFRVSRASFAENCGDLRRFGSLLENNAYVLRRFAENGKCFEKFKKSAKSTKTELRFSAREISYGVWPYRAVAAEDPTSFAFLPSAAALASAAPRAQAQPRPYRGPA